MPELKFKDFEPVLAGKEFAPIYLFHGEEDFLIGECVDTIVAKLLDPGTRGFNLDVVYGSKVSAKDVIGHAASFPMMSEHRVVVVKEFERLVAGDKAKEIFLAYLDRPLASTCLLLVSESPDFRKKPFTDLKKKAQVVACPRLYDNQIAPWIAARIRHQGKEADLEACRLLHAYVGNSLRAIQNEIDKLFIFIGDRPRLTADDIAAVVGATKGYTVFDLQNAIGRKNLKEAVGILERMLDMGESPQLIVVMLTRFFTQLYKLTDLRAKRASEGEIAGELRVSPYFVRQFVEFQGNYPSRHIEENFSALCLADVEMKSSSRDPRMVLDLLVYTLIRGVPGSVLTTA